MMRAAALRLARRAGQRAAVQQRGIPSLAAVSSSSGSVDWSVLSRNFHASARREEEKQVEGSGGEIVLSTDDLPDRVMPPTFTYEDKPEGFQWYDQSYLYPLGFLFGSYLLYNDIYIIDEETMLLATFWLWCFQMQVNFGDDFHKMLWADIPGLVATQNAKEDADIKALQEQIDDLKAQSNIVQDAQDIHALRLATYDKLNTVAQNKPMHEFKAQMERALGMIASEEVSAREKAKHDMMNEATAAVTDWFATSKDLKKVALDSAIAQIVGGGGAAKDGGDPVKSAYLKYFQEKAKAAEKTVDSDEKARLAELRQATIAKINAVGKNEGFFFEWDEATGQPKMVV